ncbi:phospho-sugar mutase [Serpentinicella alkaliphila]|uniref:Phosphoglucomutase n=1 Tax=Serpentinicella alkaliphila TaxID=1734049 RepID=A0A4V6NSF1_9FIRM|nr:phospho-sugar mutase [Serpentinicella alkaliphila]QUH25032.1 phospho-sugar mutase [Serpentinicella alkaliphila]TCQ02484.1 phosphoglucomutase [Serpentinicella alkaliphila]
MEAKTLEKYRIWVEEPCFDLDTKKELEDIKENYKEIEDRFFKEIEFGTAGLRGVIGAGTNRINKYMVRKTTQGLANHIESSSEKAKTRGVVIAYDNRRMSREFTEEAARVLTANGIKVYLFNSIRTTPELSFAIRYLNCISGIVITASHNPPEYNGYKVYWEDGAQISSEKAKDIIESIGLVNDFGSIAIISIGEATEQGLIVNLDSEIDDAYIEEVKKQSIRGKIVKNVGQEFKVVYTPLHGTGNIPVRRVLKEIGFSNVFVVPEQELPDSEFSTVKYPNPEEKEAFELAIKLAMKEDANLILGTDPDCDRVGAVVKDRNGEYVVLTGNQTGALLVEYILSGLKETGRLGDKDVIIKTIVTSELGTDIARSFGIDVINTLTGFKYIGEKIKEFEKTGENFIFGYEESFGYLAGTHARDKDAVVTSMLICEMAAYYYSKGMSLYDALMELYNKYGFYLEDLKSITLEGKDGLNKIGRIMEFFRKEKLQFIDSKKVVAIEDYKDSSIIYLDEAREVDEIDLPKADVIKFILEDGAWIALRPSGTEPKLKIYGGVKEDSMEESKSVLYKIISFVDDLIQGVI